MCYGLVSSEDVWTMDVNPLQGHKGVEMVDGLKVELVCLRDGVFEFTARKEL